MKSLLTKITLLIATFIGGIYLLKDNVVCDEDNSAVAYIRSLPHERLTKLYYDMEKYSTRQNIPHGGFRSDSMPGEFSDLDIVSVEPDDGYMIVQSCMDHGIDLKFEGIGKFKQYDKERRIVLSWGEREVGKEVIWQESRPNK